MCGFSWSTLSACPPEIVDQRGRQRGKGGKTDLVVLEDGLVEAAREVVHHPEEAQRDGVPRVHVQHLLIRALCLLVPSGGGSI